MVELDPQITKHAAAFAYFYEILKFWLPLISGFGLVIHGYRSAENGISAWADSLLNNHLHSIQAATEKTAATLVEVRDDGRKAATEVAKVRENLQKHQDADEKVQREILTTLEVLKDRG
jgi:hypothetical protein